MVVRAGCSSPPIDVFAMKAQDWDYSGKLDALWSVSRNLRHEEHDARQSRAAVPRHRNRGPRRAPPRTDMLLTIQLGAGGSNFGTIRPRKTAAWGQRRNASTSIFTQPGSTNTSSSVHRIYSPWPHQSLGSAYETYRGAARTPAAVPQVLAIFVDDVVHVVAADIVDDEHFPGEPVGIFIAASESIVRATVRRDC